MKPEVRAYTYVTFGFSLFVFAFTIISLFHGFDFSDEGFYLNSISHSEEFLFSTTQFGFIYHPMFLLFGGDVVWLRIANLLLTLFLSFSLFYSLFGSPRFKDIFGSKEGTVLPQVASSLFFSLLVLLSFRLSIFTPSYNSLNIQALLLVLIGVFHLYVDKGEKSWGRLLVAAGGALCFMAKPTSAVLLAFVVLFQLLLCTKNRWKNLFYIVVGSVAFFLLLATMIDGNPYGFFERLMGGFSYVKAMAGHSISGIFRIDRIPWSNKLTVVFGLTIAAPIVFRTFALSWQLRLYILGSILAIGALIGLSFGFWQFEDDLYIGVFVFGSVIGVLILILRKVFTQKHDLLFAILAGSYSYVYAIGSGNNYWLLISGASVFVIFGVLYVALIVERKHTGWIFLVPICIVTQIVCSMVIGLSVWYPYRQNVPLLLQNHSAAIGSGSVAVSAEAARYVSEMKNLFVESGFKINDPVIDTTGHYPGTLFVLNAKPLVHPWILGGYPGSDDFFKRGLLQTKCVDLARAWLIVERDGPRPISISALSFVGLDVNEDYEIVGAVESLLENYSKTYTQVIYRPKPIKASDLINCRRL